MDQFPLSLAGDAPFHPLAHTPEDGIKERQDRE
jgi:hypothetical protein